LIQNRSHKINKFIIERELIDNFVRSYPKISTEFDKIDNLESFINSINNASGYIKANFLDWNYYNVCEKIINQEPLNEEEKKLYASMARFSKLFFSLHENKWNQLSDYSSLVKQSHVDWSAYFRNKSSHPELIEIADENNIYTANKKKILENHASFSTVTHYPAGEIEVEQFFSPLLINSNQYTIYDPHLLFHKKDFPFGVDFLNKKMEDEYFLIIFRRLLFFYKWIEANYRNSKNSAIPTIRIGTMNSKVEGIPISNDQWKQAKALFFSKAYEEIEKNEDLHFCRKFMDITKFYVLRNSYHIKNNSNIKQKNIYHEQSIMTDYGYLWMGTRKLGFDFMPRKINSASVSECIMEPFRTEGDEIVTINIFSDKFEQQKQQFLNRYDSIEILFSKSEQI
jgi:hypothetical protein